MREFFFLSGLANTCSSALLTELLSEFILCCSSVSGSRAGLLEGHIYMHPEKESVKSQIRPDLSIPANL